MIGLGYPVARGNGRDGLIGDLHVGGDDSVTFDSRICRRVAKA
jgi:7,8-dihydropterin-6-yl-methyl-4-(beta-D-ribofuranosyl)aminobenzene 5'-phosphate synthase